jgi:hypothetical protein
MCYVNSTSYLAIVCNLVPYRVRALLMVVLCLSISMTSYLHKIYCRFWSSYHFVNLCMKHKRDRARSYKTDIFKMVANSLQCVISYMCPVRHSCHLLNKIIYRVTNIIILISSHPLSILTLQLSVITIVTPSSFRMYNQKLVMLLWERKTIGGVYSWIWEA